MRKKRSLLAILLAFGLLLTGCGRFEPQDNQDAPSVGVEAPAKKYRVSGCSAESYTMDITLDTQNNAVHGTSTVVVTNKTDAPLSELCFRLYSANISSGSISSATNTETGSKYKVNTKKDPSVIYVSLSDDALQPGETQSLQLDFGSEIPEIDDRLGCMADEGGKMYNMTFCFPQLAFYEDGAWHEAEYFEYGESYCYEMTDYHVTMTAPEDYVVMSSGKSETVNGKTVIEAPNVREMAITACNFAEIISREANGITFNILAPDYSAYDEQYMKDFCDAMLTVAVEAAELYTQKVGDYIYDELDIVPMTFTSIGGMEMPGLVQIAIPETPTQFGDDPNDDDLIFEPDLSWQMCDFSAVSTAHEIGHQWFYCAVSNNTQEEPWLDESLTSYLEYLYWDELVAGKEAVDRFNQKYVPGGEYFEAVTRFDVTDERDNDLPINLSVDEYDLMDYGEYVYSGGAWFFRELELTMGSDRFFEMLSAWYNDNLYQVVTGRALITHIQEYDSSEAVQAVINEYIREEAL